jgi:hypothetical protein
MKVISGTRQADLFGFQSIYKIGMPDEGLKAKQVHLTRFWNNLHQACLFYKYFESQISPLDAFLE